MSKINWIKSILLPAAVSMLTVVILIPSVARAQSDEIREIRKALDLVKPTQPNVDYDNPRGDDVEGCQRRWDEANSCWVFTNAGGQVIRQIFYKTINDKQKAVQWSFFKDGIEVYRDSDTNDNGKLDEHRWLGTAMRWAVDKNEDKKIDGWKMISPQEVAAEAFYAVQTGDPSRFGRLLMTPAELQSLNLGETLTRQLDARLKKTAQEFAAFARGQRKIGRTSEWVHFGTSAPSIVPKGNAGMKQDVMIHENASASFQNGSTQHELMLLGTMIRVEDRWRLVSLPEFFESDKPVTNGNLLYPISDPGELAGGPAPAQGSEISKLWDEYQKLETQLDNPRISETQKRTLTKQIAAKLLELADASDNIEDRVNWLKNYTDRLVEAYETDSYPDGIKDLNSERKRQEQKGQTAGMDYLAFRVLTASYIKNITIGDEKSRDEATDAYIEQLQEFVEKYQESENTAEALDHIAVHYEVFESSDKALEWYRKLATNFPESPYGLKARGAYKRLTSSGKKIEFKGQTSSGQRFDLANEKLRGKVVVIQYWQEYSNASVDEMEELERLSGKYDDLIIIGANLDEPEQLQQFLRKNPNVKWPQLNAPGGVEGSPLAFELGPVTVPAIYLINQDGELVESETNIEDLDRKIQRLTR